MGFFARWRAKRRLKKAIAGVKRNPSPATTIALIEAYLSLGMLDEAYSVGKQALELYPMSVSVVETVRKMLHVKYDDQIKELRAKLRVSPSPTTYAMLAEIYSEMGETEKTLELCRESTQKFPDYEGAYLIEGRIRFNRYLEEDLPKDGASAVERFEKAVKLNSNNHKILLRLGELYLDLNMPRRAIDKLRMAQARRPDDERIAQLLAQAMDMAPERDDDVEERFKQLCERRRAERESEILLRFSIEELNRIFADLPDLPGAYLAIAITPDGRRLASRIFRNIMDEQRSILCVKSIFEASDDSCKRMDIGGLRRAVFIGSAIQLHMFRFDDMIFALVADAKLNSKLVAGYLNKVIDERLYVPIQS